MKVGDVVKYYFPRPKRADKAFVLGVIASSEDESILINCEDATQLKVSWKNFDRVEVVKSFEEKVFA